MVLYIFKNALKNITSNKSRNILIGIIVLVIATSSSIALSIKEASRTVEEEGLKNLKITANISVDTKKIQEESKGDRSIMMSLMSENPAPSLEDMLKYAGHETVEDFYYILNSTVSATEKFQPYSEDDSSQSNEINGQIKIIQNKGFSGMGQLGDFSVKGYSSETAMAEFLTGESSITEGEIFTFDSADYTCVISDVLATFNDLNVGDKISITNPNNEEETYELTIKGIYSTTSETNGGMKFSTAQDPINYILMNYNTLNDIFKRSEDASVTGTDDLGNTTTTALRGQTSGTYSFSDLINFEAFQEYVKDSGLSEYYAVTSSDVESYEQGLTPIKNLNKFADVFLWLVLIIGGIILIVLNVFNIRERKYEVGVLTAIGMNKSKVATQFVCELFLVTFIAMGLGTSVGAIASEPTADILLENQLQSIERQQEKQEENFGRPMAGGKGAMRIVGGKVQNNDVQYIDNITTSINFNLILNLLGIGVLLTVVSSCGTLVFVMRYEPLKILSNRN